ncbi:transketolase, alpha subunit [Desulfitobacterium dichloroeliminans LMG P-21439]|uniref:Transketolase, alpha subunit n=1 Tax=Desulfitobacterium dichloroeliminans (strain LMG P-21439 / DCA1) TaxID=871963 RepID=L0FC59_DESDL|nr:transketolase C-terminal domain-containing protein [Desulfitobacterium dichloroeliminans]AGA70585.1 transketolase, alpha subunit [Desulfitobacterium dichloroeliminans LMG P-21439]
MLDFNRKNIRTWSMLGERGALGVALLDIGQQREDVLVLTADLCNTSGLDRFQNAFPDRLINTGIAEQNMVGMAAGLAKEGYKVFTTTFATFASMRAIEQMRNCVSYMNFDVKIVGLASGVAMGFFGNTHYGIEDIAITRAIPNMCVLSPADAAETIKATIAATEYSGPVYIRLTGNANHPIVYDKDYEFSIGKAIQLTNGGNIAIIATGSMVYEALRASEILEKQGIRSSVINMHTIKPLDTKILDEIFASHNLIVTVEEHGNIGGLGSAVAEYKAGKEGTPKQLIIGLPNAFGKAGEYKYLLDKCGLTAEKIVARILEIE